MSDNFPTLQSPPQSNLQAELTAQRHEAARQLAMWQSNLRVLQEKTVHTAHHCLCNSSIPCTSGNGVTSLARFEFEVPLTIARINDPANAWAYVPEMGVDVALNQADVVAHLMAERLGPSSGDASGPAPAHHAGGSRDAPAAAPGR